MHTRGAVLFGALLASLLSIPDVCTAQNVIVTDFHVTLTAGHVDNTGWIKAAARWTIEEGSALGYYLDYEGRTIATDFHRKRSATGYAEYWHCSYDEFKTLRDDFFSEPHTFTLEAVGNMGDTTACASYTYEPADILQIENCVAVFTDIQRCGVEISHFQDGEEGLDSCDVVSGSGTHLPGFARVVSVLVDPNTGDEYRLASDSRPEDSVSSVDLQLILETPDGTPISFASATGNELLLSLPRQSRGHDFRPNPLTLQQYDPLDPSIQYPVYDVRKVVANHGGVIHLLPLKGAVKSGVPYAYFRLSFTDASGADLNGDGILNLRDFAVLGQAWRSESAATIADMAGSEGSGMPDGEVDARDLMAFSRKWSGEFESFESGRSANLGWLDAGDDYWTIDSSQGCWGDCCARAGDIEDQQRSQLMVAVNCCEGDVSFWYRVSSEKNRDCLRFRSGNTVLGEWSGELDWQKASFSVEAGKRTFSWEYVKDSSGSVGDDTAWIDLVSFPTGDFESIAP